MFTGIVQSQGQVQNLTQTRAGVQLSIDPLDWHPPTGQLPPMLGDSVCVSGVCLTLAKTQHGRWQFDVIQETLDKTTLGKLVANSKVNLETALTLNQPLGGHFMQGHVDGVGEVIAIQNKSEDWRIRIKPPAHLMDYAIPKGSVAIEGVSLTLAQVADDSFEVALIPTTLERTTLMQCSAGDVVNLEMDILSKTIVHHLGKLGLSPSASHRKLTLDHLREAGF